MCVDVHFFAIALYNCFKFGVHNGLFVTEMLRFWGLDLGPFQTEKLFGAALFNHKLVWSSVLKIGLGDRLDKN